MDYIAKFKYGFYYNQLSIDQQFGYRDAVAAIASYASKISLNGCEEKDIHRILLAVKYDNPELFYWLLDDTQVENTQIEFVYSTKDRKEAETLVQMVRAKRKAVIEDIVDDEECMDQKNVLRNLYHYLVNTIEYATDELQKQDCPQWVYDIQGPLLKERGVCLGIAQTIDYFCTFLHIPSILVTGEAIVNGSHGNHGWNMVKLGSEYYHVDATCELENEERFEGNYKYFLVGDGVYSDRKWPRTLYPASRE